MYEYQGTQLYVNKGVGFGFRFRFGVRPEVALLTLSPA
jgi:predicted MPP superfamily phosphohydrolase